MPRKKSVKKSVNDFRKAIHNTISFVARAEEGLGEAHISRVYDAAIIFLYRDFEDLVLQVLVAAINNDTTTISSTLGVDFPRHLTEKVCYYLVTGPSYFDFKGREGLIRRVKQYVPDDHYLVTIVKAKKFKKAIERLCALRNLAAHGSPQSKKAALAATGQAKLSTAGAWLKRQERFNEIVDKLREFANNLEAKAPY